MLLLTFVVITAPNANAENMAWKIAPIFLILAYGSCMEMRETVERMVMVRTTGSDLQPAATGYIYKKDMDGPASVVKLGESEVMEHLSKIYPKPEAYKAPVPAAAGPFHEKEADETKSASHASEAYVIPVEEKSEEKDDEEKDDHIPGIANEDYAKIFEGYGDDLDGGFKGFSDYLHGAGHYGHAIYHDHGGGKDYGLKGHHESGDRGYKGYAKSHKYGKGGAGDYHTEKYESFSVSGEGGHNNHYGEADAHGKHYEKGNGYKGGDHGHKAAHDKGEEIDGYHKLFDKDEFKKDHDFYDGEKHEGNFEKYGNGHEHHGSDAGGFEKGGAHESEHHEDGFGKKGFVDKQSGDEHEAAHSGEEGEESSHHHDGNFGAKGGEYAGKGYGYEVKH